MLMTRNCATGCSRKRSPAASPPSSKPIFAARPGCWSRPSACAFWPSWTAAGSPRTDGANPCPKSNCTSCRGPSTPSMTWRLNWPATRPCHRGLLSKAERGYRLFRNTPPRPERAGEIDIRAVETPLAGFRRIALDCLAHLQSNHSGAIVGEDPEYVHQMRVATRRLRAALRMFRPALPPGIEDALVLLLRRTRCADWARRAI